MSVCRSQMFVNMRCRIYSLHKFFHCVCVCAFARFHRFPCSIVSMHDANVFRRQVLFCKRLSSISCERDVFPLSTKTRSVPNSSESISRITSSERSISNMDFLNHACITNESIVNVVVSSFHSLLFELICSAVFFITFFLPVPVTVWPALPDVKVRDREEIKNGLDVLLVFCCIIS